MAFFIYRDPELIKQLYTFSRDSASKHQANGREKKMIIKHIFEGKAVEFAVYYMFLKAFYTIPSLTINESDDGGFDMLRIKDNLKLDIKKRPGKYINLRSSNLRSDVYGIVSEAKVTKTQIEISEPLFYTKDMMTLNIQNSFNPQYLKYGWNYYIHKNSLKPMSFEDVLLNI